MARSCACRLSASVLTASGGAVPSWLDSAACCLAHSGCSLAHSGGVVWDGEVCSALRKRSSAACTCLYKRAHCLACLCTSRCAKW